MSLLTTDPTGKITDDTIPLGANINQAKLQHRTHHHYGQANGADATAATQVILGRAYAASTVLAAYVTPVAVPAGGTKTMTVDLHKSTGGGAFASILSGTTTINGSSTALTPVILSLSGTPTLVAGDILEVIVTVGGSGGTGVQGFSVDVVVAENGS